MRSCECNLLSAVCAFVTPRARIPTSRWATPAGTQRLTHQPTCAVEACRPRTAPGRRASWAIWRAAFGVCTTCWRARLRGTTHLPLLPLKAAPSLAQVATRDLNCRVQLLLKAAFQWSSHLWLCSDLYCWEMNRQIPVLKCTEKISNIFFSIS